MPKKKRKSGASVPADAIWCFYCDRTFKDESTLVTHQKAKHYRCSACNKKMNTAQGLQVHCEQVHKIKLTGVPGAKEGRENMQIEIFGMAGIPSDVYMGAPPELFRKATKRQVMLGAALVDEKGNLRPDAATNSASLIMPSMLVPPPQTLFQPGSVASTTPAKPVQPASYGGLVSPAQVNMLQTSAPLLFPQGPYTASQPRNGVSVQQQTISTSMPNTGTQAQESGSQSATIPGSTPVMSKFVFPQSGGFPGMSTQTSNPRSQFVWKNEELSMEEVRAKLAKYASPNNLA